MRAVARAAVAVLCLLVAPAGGARSGALASDEWRAPLDGPLDVVRAFAPPLRDWLPGHRGVDLGAEPGDVVRAAGAGTVTFAGVLAGRGVVTVTHGELRTTYEPLDVLVTRGEQVEVGDVIGHLDTGHGAPAPGRALLHWGLRRGDAYLDPLRLLGRGPVRLLPRWEAEQASAAMSHRAESAATRQPRPPATARTPAAPLPPGGDGGRPRAGTAVVLAMAGAAAVSAVRRRRGG